MRTILLDTSFLVTCAGYRIDLFTEVERVCVFPYSLATFRQTFHELDAVAKKGAAEKRAVAVARKLLEKVQLLPGENMLVDDLILAYLRERIDIVVATHDSILKRRVREKGVPLLIIRQRKYLQYVE